MREIQKYFCSECFTSNPSLILPVTSAPAKARNRLDSLPLMGQGYLRITHSTTAKPVIANQNPEMKKCDICDYETSSLQEIRTHIYTDHKPECERCERTFPSAEELSKHTWSNVFFPIIEVKKNTAKTFSEHSCQHCGKVLCSHHKFTC